MGNWNRRYMPRKKFRHYEYDDPPLSPLRPYNTQSHSSGVENNGVPSWEIDYCKSVRVPWHKVLASKKYIYCHPSVLNWDDSAGKEALQNAKQRYWAMINGVSCDNPLPDPDLYIDEIDWNLFIDPELMADIDIQVFSPDKAQKFEKLETINEEVECAQAEYDKNQASSENPWENHVQGTGSLKDPQGWGRWDDSANPTNDNPWEQSCSKHVDSSRDKAWRSGDESRGWYQGIDNTKSSAFVGYGCRNSCNYIRQTVAVKQEGWGHRENNSWSWSHGNEGSRNSGNCGYSYENKYSSGSNEKGWRDNKNGSWGWRDNRNEPWGWRDKRNESQGWRESDGPIYWDSRSFGQGGRSFRGGCRKRESSVQHTTKYKSSRYHGDTYGDR